MKRNLILSLVLALAMVLILPTVAMAAPASAYANGKMIGIDTGDVKPVGETGKWIVSDRHITGVFTNGALSGNFTITYGGVFTLSNQSGNMHGIMETGSDTFAITGKVSPYTLVDAGGYYLPRLEISGHWAGLKDCNACGDFTAWMIFIPDAEGHVLAIPASEFIMTQKNTSK